MSNGSRAVFLSYASQDAEAARRLCEAMGRAGVEVWFDQGKLRGGDAWDAKIRKQIKECALFMPVISAATQARAEGYFRLEWKLAVDRSHLRADDTAFLFPVVIDDVPDAAARVPDKFREVQWTRLQAAGPLEAFAAEVARLLGGEPAGAGSPVSAVVQPASRGTRQAKAARWGWLLAATMLGLGAVAWWTMGRRQAGPPAPAVLPVSDKSIAVLPFTNMSEDKDNGFFADGVQEDILTNLAKISELKVISRTSVMQYRGTTKSIRQISTELGVAYILEGSVRRAGNTVRVTGQLIRAATDEHIWAEPYDADLTDIFAVQARLAKTIAGELKAVLTPRETDLIEARPTSSLKAYELYQRAREISRVHHDADADEQNLNMEALLQQAVGLDPAFAEGWGALVHVQAVIYFDGVDADGRGRLAKIETGLAKLKQIAPGSAALLQAQGDYCYFCFRDYPNARKFYQQVVAAEPNNSQAIVSLGLLERRLGHWTEALAKLRRALELDPLNRALWTSVNTTLAFGGRYADQITLLKGFLAMEPENRGFADQLADLQARLAGRPAVDLDWFDRLPRAYQETVECLGQRLQAAWSWGNAADALRSLRAMPPGAADDFEGLNLQAMALIVSGDRAGARPLLEKNQRNLEQFLSAHPDRQYDEAQLALTRAMLGDHAGALAAIDHVRGLVPESADRTNGPRYSETRALVLAWLGEKDEAITEIARLVRTPAGIQAETLATTLDWTPLHGDPRFEAIARDPANRAPKF